MKIKKPASKAGFSNLAPLTGIAFAINWLIGKLNLKFWVVKTTKMTTNLVEVETARCWRYRSN